MPTVILNKKHFFEAVGFEDTFSDEDFDKLCFEFGIELDDVTSERQMAAQELGKDNENLKSLSDEVLYKIEVGANRYDLLCLEGLAQALRIFLGKEKPTKFTLTQPLNVEKFYIDSSVKDIRPFACSAILRNITFTEETLKSFIDLQDKLHQNICRQRTLVTMGTHDLDTVKGPFTFKAKSPSEIVFKALKQTEEMNGFKLIETLKNDQKLKKYLYLLENHEKFPVLYDSQGIVMALPPLINSEHSKITVNTKNVIIDVTAHDETKANIVLNILVTMFSVYSKEKFTIEPVEVIDSLGKSEFYPKLNETFFKTTGSYLTKLAGTGELTADQIKTKLERMNLFVKTNENDEFTIIAPPTRTDILHPCDIAEDLAISYGYNNIQKIQPTTICNGYQQPINKLTDLIRLEMAMSGYTEALTFSLISKEDSISKMGEEISEKTLKAYVQVLKAKTHEFELVRTSLIPGLLKTIDKNQVNPLPLKLFEIADVVVIDSTSETGAVNKRRLCFAYANNNSGFEVLQGVLDHLLENKLDLKWGDEEKGYVIKPSNDRRFFPDRQAEVVIGGKVVGIFGIVHPEVSKRFGKIMFPVSIAEIEIEVIFNMIVEGKLLATKERKG